ncbi:MAG: hypothetical protein KF778_05395 [Rhodocyclaceae bacterium]|nr:hypothetical protein [Rhodocyclaceae bacterium]MBX3667817.1 hypothetical protein [Rhodocyclaceae bacterium]
MNYALLVLLVAAVPAVAATQPRIPPAALHVSENPKDGTTWTKLASGMTDIAWRHAGGDWLDAKRQKQGTAAWATANFTNTKQEQPLALNLTKLVNEHIAGAIENRGWFIHAVDNAATSGLHSKDSADAAKRPLLVIDEGLPTEQRLSPQDDIQIASSSVIPSQSVAASYTAGSNTKVAIYFDLTGLLKPVTSAVLQLTTTDAQFGGRYGSIGVLPVDLSDRFAPIAVESGIAAHYDKDAGIASDPAVLLFENFASLDMEQHGWVYAVDLDRRIVGSQDPDNRAYKPLAPDVKAYRMSIGTGKYGGDFGRWLFWSNLGHEPEQMYQRAYVFIADDFDSMAGKFPLGWDGTYTAYQTLRSSSGKVLTNNPVTGRPWSRPDRPAAAGNGGGRSKGNNGWSARGGFVAQPCDASGCLPEASSALFKSNYRPLHYYTYHADQADFFGTEMGWRDGLLGLIPKNTWVCIDQYVKLNTLNADGSGNRDGVLRTWIDGRLAFQVNTLRMRNWPGNFDGADNIRIYASWLNFYHGGRTAAQSPMTVYMSNLVIAKRFIGPGKFKPGD